MYFNIFYEFTALALRKPTCCVRFTYEAVIFRLDHAHGAVPVEPQQPADPNPLNEDAIPMDPGVALALPANNIPERQNANEVGVGNNH